MFNNFKDIDECARPGVCRPEETCLNTRGGYYCNAIVCPPNYVRDTEHRKYVPLITFHFGYNINDESIHSHGWWL